MQGGPALLGGGEKELNQLVKLRGGMKNDPFIDLRFYGFGKVTRIF